VPRDMADFAKSFMLAVIKENSGQPSQLDQHTTKG